MWDRYGLGSLNTHRWFPRSGIRIGSEKLVWINTKLKVINETSHNERPISTSWFLTNYIRYLSEKGTHSETYSPSAFKPNHVMCWTRHENSVGLSYVLLPRIPATELQSKFGFLLECNMDSLFWSSTCIREGVNFRSLRNWTEMPVGSYPLSVGLQSGVARIA